MKKNALIAGLLFLVVGCAHNGGNDRSYDEELFRNHQNRNGGIISRIRGSWQASDQATSSQVSTDRLTELETKVAANTTAIGELQTAVNRLAQFTGQFPAGEVVYFRASAFDIGETTITPEIIEDLQVLELAQKKGFVGKATYLAGTADPFTGTPLRNLELSLLRAKNGESKLKEMGLLAPTYRLEGRDGTRSYGGSENPEDNRCLLIGVPVLKWPDDLRKALSGAN